MNALHYELGFARGQLRAVEEELARTLRLLATRTGERDYYKGELGDLRDGVDALTTCRSLDDLRVKLDDLRGTYREESVTGPEMTAREVYGVGR